MFFLAKQIVESTRYIKVRVYRVVLAYVLDKHVLFGNVALKSYIYTVICRRKRKLLPRARILNVINNWITRARLCFPFRQPFPAITICVLIVSPCPLLCRDPVAIS